MGLILLGWLGEAVLAFWLYQKAWRYDEDLRVEDLALFVFFSLIPFFGLVVAGIVWLAADKPTPIFKNKIVLPKYNRERK